MGTISIAPGTRILADYRLQALVVHFHCNRTVCIIHQLFHLPPPQRLNRVQLPVRPEDYLRLEKRYAVGVWETRDYCPPVRAIPLDRLQEMQFAIHPVNGLRQQVHRQSVRPEDVLCDQNDATRRIAVHGRSLDLWRLSPIGPHKDTTMGNQADASWLVEICPEEHLPVFAVDRDHLDAIRVAVGPINVLRVPGR